MDKRLEDKKSSTKKTEKNIVKEKKLLNLVILGELSNPFCISNMLLPLKRSCVKHQREAAERHLSNNKFRGELTNTLKDLTIMLV